MNELDSLPRVPLVAAPTPLQRAPRLSAALGSEVWLKREDMTGLGLGGNKLRGLEYLLGEATARGCDCLVTGGGAQSNWAMLAALTSRRCGLDPYLVFYGSPAAATGNLMLDNLIGADVRFTGELDRASVDVAIEKLADELTAAGRKPYAIPRGGATALGAAGYVRVGVELADQFEAYGVAPSRLWLATGSCSTQAGLLAAARWLHSPYEVVGVAVSRQPDECITRIRALAEEANAVLGLPPTDDRGVTVLDGYLGPGYGLPSGPGAVAAQLVARTEGVFLDPVFGAKAMAALMDAACTGQLDGGPVVFIVGGGGPTLFAGSEAAM
jgi:D-cysteine desulfhydrase